MNKGKKTTIVAYFAAGVIIALLVALFLDKITADDFFKGLTSVGAAAVVFIGFLSKDYDKSHSKNLQNVVDPDNPKYPPKKT